MLAALFATDAGAATSADFGDHTASPEVRQVAQWISESADNAGRPFILIDKVAARVFVFNAAGKLQGDAAALLGSARGDRTAAGIGKLSLGAIRPEDRTTPAGRFVAHLDQDIHGRSILLIDYDASIALHPVVPGTPKERRAERLRSATPDDNRISFGCINVPPEFFNTVVRPAFRRTHGIVYILPETRAASELFGNQARVPASAT
ncbi:MAG: hypothetical protein K0M64_06765 [Rhizobium sp.]|nr:hypothetical protein [Rhizobium sp.]